MSELSEYKIEFIQDSVFKMWTYEIDTPDGRTLCPPFGGMVRKESCEQAALNRIKVDQARYTLTGDKLKEKLDG